MTSRELGVGNQNVFTRAKRLDRAESDGEFEKLRSQEIVPLDMRNHRICLNRLAIRLRTTMEGKAESE